MPDSETLLRDLTAILEADPDLETSSDSLLELLGGHFEAITVTLHYLDPASGMLCLVGSRGIPEKLIPITRRIPVGKGMAGLCAERREPVEVCNLQQDDSGQARPGARETRVEGGIVVPVLETGTGEVVGTLGIGKPSVHEYTDGERETLEACARRLEEPLHRHRSHPPRGEGT